MAHEQRTVLCFGDSNTHGTVPMNTLDDRARLAPDERWPGVMAAALGSGWRLVEEALPGRTTVHDDPIEGVHKNGLAALPMALESHLPIDCFVLMLGTNDLKARHSVTAFDIAESAGRLVDVILASDVSPDGKPPRVLLIAPPSILETGCLAGMFEGGAAKSQALGTQYRRVTEHRGVDFLDAGTLIQSSTVDGIHLEVSEHAKLGRAVADAITN